MSYRRELPKTMNNTVTLELPRDPPVSSMRLLGARPPSRIGGKVNPEYARWYRMMNPDSVTKYNHSEKAKTCRKRHYSKAQSWLHEQMGKRYENQTKCVECGQVFDRNEAHIRGYKMLPGNRGYRCICDECA